MRGRQQVYPIFRLPIPGWLAGWRVAGMGRNPALVGRQGPVPDAGSSGSGEGRGPAVAAGVPATGAWLRRLAGFL